jgi:hypothetical protein
MAAHAKRLAAFMYHSPIGLQGGLRSKSKQGPGSLLLLTLETINWLAESVQPLSFDATKLMAETFF